MHRGPPEVFKVQPRRTLSRLHCWGTIAAGLPSRASPGVGGPLAGCQASQAAQLGAGDLADGASHQEAIVQGIQLFRLRQLIGGTNLQQQGGLPS